MSSTTTLLTGGLIYTSFSSIATAESILLHEGKVLAVGQQSDLTDLATRLGGIHEIEDLAGRVVIPGLIDAHIHLEHYSRSLKIVDCETETLEECLARLTKRGEATPPGEWILGHGWNQNAWNTKISAEILDDCLHGHPVYISAKSLHAAVANKLAFERAGISMDTPDPTGGQIERKSDGLLSGILYENAMRLITKAIPQPDIPTLGRDLETAQEALWKFGLTGVHDFDGSRCFSALQLLRERETLGLRILKNIPVDLIEHAIELGLRSGFGDKWIRIGNIKIFSDGALGPRTAAMLEPYLDEPENRGLLLVDQEEIFEVGRRSASYGLGLTIHAIGDRANHEVLQAFSKLREYEIENKLQPLRHRVEHLQLLHRQDLGECSRHNVIASMQPIHATSDMEMADRYWGERAEFAYAWRSQLDNGTHLVFGSDAPVESPNPFWGIYAAISRRRHDGSPGGSGWYPEQRIELLEAFRAYTTGPAYAAYNSGNQGHLLTGADADLIVLEENPFEVEPVQIKDILPAGTMVAGEWKYRSF